MLPATTSRGVANAFDKNETDDNALKEIMCKQFQTRFWV